MNEPIRRTSNPSSCRQQGAVFLVMLVVMVLGITAILVGTLNKATLNIAKNEQSSELLARAKEVVIGYAVGSGGPRPGDLLKPDVASESPPNYDGTAQTACLDSTKVNGLPLTTNISNIKCLGRLPWKNYGMSIDSPSENDPTGRMPWYAVAPNLYDYPATPFNSELLNKSTGWLTVRDSSGNVLSNRVVFILIIPGAALAGQSRPASPLAGANAYLDSITVPSTCTAPCVPGIYKNFDMDNDFIMGDDKRWITNPSDSSQKILDSSYQFNDKLIYVTIDEYMPLIEKRIAREVKGCLDSYASKNGGKYPWAVPLSDTSSYTGVFKTRFGRISAVPSNALTTDSNALALIDALRQLQNALTIYTASKTSSNFSALRSAGSNLQNATYNLPDSITYTTINYANNAGTTASNLSSNPVSSSTLNYISSNINSALSGLNNDGVIDNSMKTAWDCPLLTLSNSYWDEWKNLIFYRVASRPDPYNSNLYHGFVPGSTDFSCTSSFFSCLSLTGSGNTNTGSGSYRATVLVAGKILTAAPISQANPRNTSSQTDYLEGSNAASNPTTFETYKTSDSNYSTVNDLVLCLDGKVNCQ